MAAKHRARHFLVVPAEDTEDASEASPQEVSDTAAQAQSNALAATHKRRRRRGMCCCRRSTVPYVNKIRAGLLKNVSYAKMQLDADDLLQVWDAVKQSPSLERLELTGSDLHPVLAEVVQVLRSNKRLNELVLDTWTLPVQSLKGVTGRSPAIEITQTPIPKGARRRSLDGSRGLVSAAADIAARLLALNEYSKSVTFGPKGAPLPVQELRGEEGAAVLTFAQQQLHVDAMAVVARLLANNMHVTGVDLSGNKLTAVMAAELKEVIVKNDHLASLNLSRTNLGGLPPKAAARRRGSKFRRGSAAASDTVPDLKVLELLCEGLAQNHSLTVLDVSCNGLCGLYPRFAGAAPAEELGTRNLAALEMLCDAVMNNHGLCDVDMHGNAVKDSGVPVVTELIRARFRTRNIDLRSNGIGVAGAKEILAALERNVHMRVLCGVPIHDMRDGLLQDLDMSGTKTRQIDAGDAHILAHALDQWSGPISAIDLRGNELTSESAAIIGRAMLRHGSGKCRVEFLRCDDWSIVPEPPASQIKRHRGAHGELPTGQQLDLTGKQLSLGSVTLMAGVMKHNTQLQRLKMRHMKIEPAAKALIGNAWLGNRHGKLHLIEYDRYRIHRKSTMIDLAGKGLMPEEVVLLAGVLKGTPTIDTVNLCNNNVGSDGGTALALALRANKTITELSLNHAQLGEAGALGLQHLLKPKTAKDRSHSEQCLMRESAQEHQAINERAAREKERVALKREENGAVGQYDDSVALQKSMQKDRLETGDRYKEALADVERLQHEEDEQEALIIKNELMKQKDHFQAICDECMQHAQNLKERLLQLKDDMKAQHAAARVAKQRRQAKDKEVDQAKRSLRDRERKRKRRERELAKFTKAAKHEEETMVLQRLSLADNNMGDRGKRALGNALLSRCASRLQFLSMETWSVGPEDRALELANVQLGTTDVMLIAGILKGNRLVHSLDLRGSFLDQVCKTAIGYAILRNPHSSIRFVMCDTFTVKDVPEVDLSQVEVTTADVVLLAAALKRNSTVKSVRLPSSYIGDDEGGQAMIQAIDTNSTLERINDVYLETSKEANFDDYAYTLLKSFEKRFVMRRLVVGANSLATFTLARNDMGASELMPLARSLKSNKSVTKLDVSGNNLRDYGGRLLAAVLRTSTTLRVLDIRKIHIGAEGKQRMGRALLDNDSSGLRELLCDEWIIESDAEVLDMTEHQLQPADIFLLGATARHSVSLHTLVLSNIWLCPKIDLQDRIPGGPRFNISGFGALSRGLAKNASITKLGISKTRLPTGALRQLCDMLLVNDTLRSIDMRHNFVTEDGSVVLGAALLQNRSLQEFGVGNSWLPISKLRGETCAVGAMFGLNMQKSGFHIGGSCVVAGMVAGSRNLTTLDLSQNDMYTQGASAMALALKTNRSIHTLVLTDNKLGINEHNNTDMKGIEDLSAALSRHPTVTCLNLQGNYMTGMYPEYDVKGLQAFVDAMRTNRFITYLDLSFNNLCAKGAISVSDLFTANRTISSYDISNNHFGADGARHVAVGLRKNRGLTRLDISQNRLTGDQPFDDTGGIVDIAESLEEVHNSLVILDLHSNHVSDGSSASAGCYSLGGVIAANTTLEWVLLNSLPLLVQDLRGAHARVTSLDFSGKDIALDDLAVISCLIANNAVLRSIDFRANPKINTIEGSGALGSALSKNQTARVEYVFMDRWSLGPTTVELNLTLANLAPYDMVLMGAVLRWNTTLQTLILRQNNICGVKTLTQEEGYDLEGLQQLCAGLAANAGVTLLDLSQNSIRHEGAKLIADMLLQNEAIRTIHLGHNGLCRVGYSSHARQIVETLKHNKTLTYLSLHNNFLQPDVLEALAKVLPLTNTIRHIDLRNSVVSKKAGDAFAHAMEHNYSLELLGLGNSTLDLNMIKDDRLTELNLARGFLGSGGVIIICKLLQYCEQLKKLDLAENGMGIDGGKAVAELMAMNENIQFYGLAMNGLCGIEYDFALSKWKGAYDLSVLNAMCSSVRSSKADRTIDISMNNIKADTARLLRRDFGKSFNF